MSAGLTPTVISTANSVEAAMNVCVVPPEVHAALSVQIYLFEERVAASAASTEPRYE